MAPRTTSAASPPSSSAWWGTRAGADRAPRTLRRRPREPRSRPHAGRGEGAPVGDGQHAYASHHQAGRLAEAAVASAFDANAGEVRGMDGAALVAQQERGRLAGHVEAAVAGVDAGPTR